MGLIHRAAFRQAKQGLTRSMGQKTVSGNLQPSFICRCVVSAVSCSMAVGLRAPHSYVSSLSSSMTFIHSSPLRLLRSSPLHGPDRGHALCHAGRSRMLGRPIRSLGGKRQAMSGTDAGYSFEEYDSKRSSFEPSTQKGLTEFTVPWPQYYCAPDLDRTGVPALHDAAAFEKSLRADNARFIIVYQGKNLVRRAAAGSPPKSDEAVFLPWDEVSHLAEDEQSVKICVGDEAGFTYFGLDVSHLDDFSPPEGMVFEQLRTVGGTLSRDEDAGLLATARGMGVWHRTSQYCSSCGSEATAPQKAGSGRRCGSCGAGFYPRLDPSVIVAVTDATNEHILLGRKAAWPNGRYSILAGFTEMGESLEETVLREVLEESGVRVRRDSLSFFASQPWPFPRSLMIGFTGTAESSEGAALPKVEFPEDEMEDVRWFSKEEVIEALGGRGELSIPGRAALARSMIARWATGKLV